MGQAIGDVLAPAIGVALSPFPIVAVILMLFSARAKTNGPAFVAGWVMGLVMFEVLVLILADPVDIESTDDGPSTVASVFQLVLGVGLVLLGLKNWAARPRAGVEPATPKWMATIDKTTPLVALGLGALFSTANPKNLIFNLAAGMSIARSGASISGEIVTVIVYVLLASVSVVGPVLWYLVSPTSASAKLDQLRIWLIHNNALIMAVILLLLGVVQIGQGLSGFGA